MSSVALSQDDIFANAKALRAAGVPLAEIERYMDSKTGTGGTPLVRALRRHDPSAVAKIVARQNTNDAEAAEGPSYASQALGGLSALNPLTALGAMTRSAASGDVAAVKRLLGNKDAKGQSYREALTDIGGAEETAHPAVRTANRIIGGTVAGAAIPIKSPIGQGATYGALAGLTQADPDAGLEERAEDAAAGAGVGALGGSIPGAAKWMAGRAGLGMDLALAMAGRPERAARRLVTALDDVRGTPKASTAPAAPPHQPTAEGFVPNEPPTTAGDEPRRLLSLARQPSHPPTAAGPSVPDFVPNEPPVASGVRAAERSPLQLAPHEVPPAPAPARAPRRPAKRPPKAVPALAQQPARPAEPPGYPRTTEGATVDGRVVGKDIPNTASISASLGDDFTTVGLREVPASDFDALAPNKMFYAADDIQRVKELASEIQRSGRIDPLIVAVDKDGPYILEGAHRAAALHTLGAKSFPALVVEEAGAQYPARAAVAAVESASGLTPDVARLRLQQLLQKNVDEGMEALSPEPPTNWDLMAQLEQSLKLAKAQRAPTRGTAP